MPQPDPLWTVPVLEPAALAFAADTAQPPFLPERGPGKGREAVVSVQPGEVPRPAADIEEFSVPGGPSGTVSLRIVRPAGLTGTLPAVLYLHGAGRVFGDAQTHDRLVRELATRAGAAAVFVNYTRSPEARYPVAVEECFAALRWIAADGADRGLDPTRIAIAGDSVGGNLAAAVTLLAKQRGGPTAAGQLLYYPVTDARFGTPSYQQFGTDHWLRRDAMQWYWDQYAPDPQDRAEATCAPLRATVEELTGLPPALVVVGEADVLRDEGEAYAARLRQAGVTVTAVRYQGIIHDFVLLDALRDTHAARSATDLGGRFLYDVLH